MPYPHSQRPLFREFKRRLIGEYQCKYETMDIRIDQNPVTLPYFVREMAGKKLRAVAAFKDDQIVEFSDIRRICRMLDIPPAAFGLDLDPSWYDPEPSDDSDSVN